MAKLVLSREFLQGFPQLEKSVQNRVLDLQRMFEECTLAELGQQKGVNFEAYENQLDDRARTVRINDNLRGIACLVGSSNLLDEKVILDRVLSHEEAERWMMRCRFKANTATGAVEVEDMEAIEAAISHAPRAAPGGRPPLFGHRKDKEFQKFGISVELLPLLRKITDDIELLGLTEHMPEAQGNALLSLAGQDSVEEIFREIAGSFEPESISEDDLEAALESPVSQNTYAVVANDEELRAMLDKPMALWRTFLHHSQRDMAYKPQFNGSARITGGAGTGKTVVAMHRAKYLASQLDGAEPNQILFATYNKNLAQNILNDLLDLGGTDLTKVVEVVNVDKLAREIVREAEEGKVDIATGPMIDELWDDVIAELDCDFKSEFLQREWEQVVLAQRCRSQADYFAASRTGQGVRLDRRSRAQVWKAVEAFTAELAQQGRRTFLQVADDATDCLTRRAERRYRHVIVDEAQDLHPSQWRMLREAVAEGPNDLFIVGDSHQRIYRHHASLSSLGINIRGRSRKLRINYRTTHEIMRWSLKLLGEGGAEEGFDDLDEGSDSLDFAGYHSFMRGPEPTLCRKGDIRGLNAEVTQQIKHWIEGGVHGEHIAAVARRKKEADALREALQQEGIEVCDSRSAIASTPGVRVGTMHSVKGMEFRCVVVFRVTRDRLPDRAAIAKEEQDPTQYRADVLRERCLLYVACSRAREHLWVGYFGNPSRFLAPHLPTGARV